MGRGSEFALMSTGNQGFMDGNINNSNLGGGHAQTPLSGWSKLKLGWANYTEIATDGPINFPSFDADDDVYVRFINDTDHSNWDEGEYFIVENRRPLFSGGNRTFDGDMINGLLIWHRANSNWPNSSIRLDVKEANGINEAGSAAGSCKNAHLFPGTTSNTAFTPYTTPNTNKKDGSRSGLALTHIKLNGSGASAYVSADAYTNFYTGSWSGNVTTNIAWGGTVTVTTNVTVNNGATLTIDPGSTIQFATGTSLTVNGKLAANSTDGTQRITFTRQGTSGSWGGIKINSGSSTNVSTLRRCDVQYAIDGVTVTYTGNTNNVTIDKCRINSNVSYGIYVYGSSGATVHPVISNNHVHDNGDGIYLYNYAKPLITGNRIESNLTTGIFGSDGSSATVEFNYVRDSGYGIAFVVNSLAQVHRNTVTECVQGAAIYADYSSNLIAYGSGNSKGRNKIVANNGDGIYSIDSSPVFGKATLNQGYNQVQDNTGYQAVQSASGQLKAEYCYWAGQQNDISGNVDNSPYWASVPNPVGWGQGDSYDPSTRVMSDPDVTNEEASPLMKIASGQNGVSGDEFDAREWSAKFDSVMNTGLEKDDWAAAAEVVTALWRELQDGRTPNVNYALLDDYSRKTEVESSIRKYLALTLVEKSLTERKISQALEVLETYRRTVPEHKAELLANAGIINLNFMNDLAAAQSVLAQLHTLAAQNDLAAARQVKLLAKMIENHRRRFEGSSPAEGVRSAQMQTNAGEAPLQLNTFPNPFNPETMIRYRVSGAEAQEVSLMIYNSIGQRVRALVETRKNPGDHSVMWDGRDHFGKEAASGMYFLRATVSGKVLTRKLMLVR